MINDIIKDIIKAVEECDNVYLSPYEAKCLYEYIMSINELIENQSEVIKELTLKKVD